MIAMQILTVSLNFSFFDMMDGQRAKRLKCGTPIGRIIDEAGDAMVYTWAAHILGYVINLPPVSILAQTLFSTATSPGGSSSRQRGHPILCNHGLG